MPFDETMNASTTGNDPNAEFERSKEQLIDAVLRGKAESVKTLIREGADVNAREHDRMSALQIASREGHTDIVRILLDNGADIESRGEIAPRRPMRRFESFCTELDNIPTMSPLNVASWKGIADIVRILLDNGADIESRDSEGRTPLFNAAEKGHTDVINLLIGDGARTKIPLKDGTSANTGYRRKAESVKERREGANVNAGDISGMSPLHVASKEGFTDIVRILLDNGADIESRDEVGCTPLFIAAKRGHIDVVRLLIGECAGVNIPLNDRISATTAVSTTGHFGEKSLLQHSGADVDAENFYGQRPIHWAVESGCVELVELLIQHGANVNAADVDGNRPLHAAVDHGLDVVQLLVQHGAKLNVQNNNSVTPLHIQEQLEVTKFLLNQDADGFTDFWRNQIHYILRNLMDVSVITHKTHATPFRNATYVRSEKYLDNPLTYVDCQGNTPLHYAVVLQKMWKYKLVTFLLPRGADINAQNNEGLTPLHLAFLTGDEEAIGTFLQYANDQSFIITDKRGRNFWHLLFLFRSNQIIEAVLDNRLRQVRDISSAHSVDDLSRTPLHYACMRKFSQFSEKQFSDYEFINDGDKQDKFGRTVLHYAAIAPNPEILEFLVSKKVNDSIRDMFGKTCKDYMTMRKVLDDKVCDIERLYNNTYLWDFWGREVFAAIFSDLEQHNGHEFRRTIGEIREGSVRTQRLKGIWWFNELKENSDRISIVRNIYLACVVNYTEHRKKETKRKQVTATVTATQSTAMFGAIDNCVTKAMEYLASEISAYDGRFACEVLAVGSAYERTKIGCCDEFDYNFVLTNLSRMCKVCYSPESPPGFVLLKASTSEYDEDLFNCNGILDARIVKFRFKTLVKQILSSLCFCEMTGFEYLARRPAAIFAKKLSTKCNTCIKLSFTHPVNGHHVLHEISVDIVPALQINDWWPEDARRQDLCQTGDCLIVFSQPQKKYPWIGWTKPQGFISFARAESRLLRESPQVVKAAYMVVKHMSKHFCHYILKFFSSHVIKTSLLWCQDEEGFSNCSSSDDNDEINEDELLRLVQNIMRRLLCFAAQDYVPCYFMPKCHQPVWHRENYLKHFHIRLFQSGMTYRDLLNFTEEQLKDIHVMGLHDIYDNFVFSHFMYWTLLSDADELKLFVSSTINPVREISYESDD